jgi:hypothetical protein
MLSCLRCKNADDCSSCLAMLGAFQKIALTGDDTFIMGSPDGRA